MMLRLLNSIFAISFVILISIKGLSAQDHEEVNTDEKVIGVLITSAHLKSDSTVTEHAKMMRIHMDYLSKIHTDKQMLSSLSFQGGGGLMFFKNNLDSIKALLSHDPAIKKGMFKLTYYTWTPEKGDLCQSDKSSKLTNVHVHFMSQNKKAKNKLTDTVLEEQKSLLKEISEKENTLFTGKIEKEFSYILVSRDGSGLELISAFTDKNKGLFTEKNYKAWAPEATFCE